MATRSTEPSPLEEHFRSPRNTGVLEGADLAVRAENPVCGDILQLYVSRDPAGRVSACKFQAFGCPAAIAAGSLLTEMVQGKSVDDLKRLSQDMISKALGGLAADKLHAAVLAKDAARKVVDAWTR